MPNRIAALLVLAATGAATVVVAGGVSFSQFTAVNLGGDTTPAWSPDGSRVYYVSPSGGFPYVYFKAPGAAANTPGTRMTSWLNDEKSVTASPDGQWACLVTTDSLSSTHLYRLPATGGNPLTKMTFGPFEDLHATWWGSGVSSVVAFASNRGGAGHQLWTLAPNGTLPATDLTQITDAGHQDLFPSWAPDGQSIVFSSDRSGTSQIYVVHRAGAGWGAPIALTSGSTARSNPEFSPSGAWIAYQEGGSGGTSLWIMESNGQNPHLVSSSGSYEGEPVWAPDGNQIAFASNRSGATYIWLVHDVTTPADPVSWGRLKNRYR